MTNLPMERAGAFELLGRYNKSQSLIRHALCVEAVMRYFAELYGEDAELWGMVGLLHDLDYEQHPDAHCRVTPLLLEREGFDESFVNAVLSHGYGLCTDVKPVHIMEKVLYTTDELTGLITACALMRPSKSVLDLPVKSVKKKFGQASFAASVNREVITKGAEMMGITLEELLHHTIEALKTVADEIGLGANNLS